MPEYHNFSHSNQLDAALKYAAKGIPVFPLEGKTPLTPHGFKDATTDRSRIHAWWNSHPGANIGVPTGSASGLVVVDRDGDSEEARRIWGTLPPTLEVKTARGAHRYYQVPKGTKVKSRKLGPDLDLKADGGYVVAPPSVHPSGARYLFVEETRAIGIADLPDSLLVEPKRLPRAPKTNDNNMIVCFEGPIPEGSRNTTLFFAALDLKDSGSSRDEALDVVLTINQTRCAPSLGDDEVTAVVTSAFRYPMRGSRTPPEVMDVLAGLTWAWWASPWKGVGGKSERDILRVLIQWAERYGYMITTGVRISISFRDLAIAAGSGLRTIQRAIKRLKVRGWLRGDNAERSGPDSGAFVLLPRLTDHTHSPRGSSSPRGTSHGESVVTLSRLPEETPCFRWRGFVGKGRAGVLNALEVFGEQTPEELAERLGWSRVRDLRSRCLLPLVELGLVDDRGGVFALVGDYRQRVEKVRRERYGGGKRKVTSTSPDGRVVSRVIYVPAKSEVERDEDDHRSYEGQRRRYRERLGLAPVVAVDVAPTEEEMREHRESFDARRSKAIEEAIACLFSERPGYRARRVGQITCAIVPYLETDFPRGGAGLPKDAEVEAILDGVAA